MFGRKKSTTPPVRGTSPRAFRPGRDETIRVLRAFLAKPPSGGSGLDPSPPGQPPLPVTSAPMPASPFTFNISEFVGDGYPQPLPAGPDPVIDFPGIGAVSASELKRAGDRVEQVLQEISGGADLLRNPDPALLMAALERLDSMHARGGVTDEQYEALVAAAAFLVA